MGRGASVGAITGFAWSGLLIVRAVTFCTKRVGSLSTVVSSPTWQLILVVWGTKYGVDELNQLIQAVVVNTLNPPRVVMVSDRARPGLLPEVEVRMIPEFYLNPELMQAGCQTKLAIFEEGVLPDDLPAIFVDIDTMVMGDLAQMLPLAVTPQNIVLFQSAVLPFGSFARWLWTVTKTRRYARGNSSIIVFHPAHCGYVAKRFRSLFAEHGGLNYRPMIADERFISWVAQPYMAAIPRRFAVKFPTEFMWSWRWFIYVRGAMPWNRRRWSKLTALTLPGLAFKGQDLVALPEGAEMQDRKGRRLIWSGRALGPIKRMIIDYYSPLDTDKKTGETL